MAMYSRIKISKRVHLPMVAPGTRDSSVMPSSGGSASSGISLDYSALGIDNGVPYNHTDDGYVEENEVDDDNNKGNGSFVGSKEEGFALRHNLDYGSTANLTALVIKGNAKFVMDNATAEEFYVAVSNYLQGMGYKVSFDVSETRDLAYKADLIIGHSNGLFKLNRCKEDTKLIAFGAIPEKATNSKIVFANHPVDEQYLKKCHANLRYDYPIPEHFIFTNEMKVAINKATVDIIKKAYPDYPQYSDPEMYTQVSDRMPATPSFNLFNTYYADDGYALQRERKKEVPRGALQREKPKTEEALINRGPLQRERQVTEQPRGALQRERPKQPIVMNDDIEVLENSADVVETIDEYLDKKAFVKTAISYDSNSVIQELIKIPEVKAVIDQHGSGFVDKIIVTTPSADIQQTQQNTKPTGSGVAPITLQPISGDPYGHVWISEDPTTHQKKHLDKIVRIDRVTDQYGTLVTILHEIGHHRHPDWSESQVESEAETLANTIKQHLGGSKDASGKTGIIFAKRGLHSMPLVQCDLADTYQKQVIGLQSYSSLRPDSGLLFTYANPQPLTFWMGKVSFPIDIVFANDDNKIVKIYRNCQPNSSELYSCDKASKVIEVVGSFCTFHDIDVGDHVFYADDKEEGFTRHILESIQEAKLAEQKDLDMTDWNIKIVVKQNPDSRRFLKVSWSPEDYRAKKADILVNPNAELIREALKEMPLGKLVRHALLHILAGAKNELPEDKEQKLITNKLY